MSRLQPNKARTITLDGITDTIQGWASRRNNDPTAATIVSRLKSGKSEREAVMTRTLSPSARARKSKKNSPWNHAIYFKGKKDGKAN